MANIFRTHKPNWMYWIVPTMMRDLMRHPAWPDIDMKGLKTHVAGELVPPDVEAALRDKGAIVGSMYGLTEAMPVCVLSSSLYYRDEASVPVVFVRNKMTITFTPGYVLPQSVIKVAGRPDLSENAR